MGRMLLRIGVPALMIYLGVLLLGNVQPASGGSAAGLQAQLPGGAGGAALPYEILGTGLVVESLGAYDGPFLEDGMDNPVEDTAAIVLRNTGDTDIVWAQVILQFGQKQMVFFANTVPAGEAVRVLEKEAQSYTRRQLTGCRGQAVQATEEWLPKARIQMEEMEDGNICVTNLTDTPMQSLRFYYKRYDTDTGIYQGGITYYTDLVQLDPGEMAVLEPPSSLSGSVHILRVSYL